MKFHHHSINYTTEIDHNDLSTGQYLAGVAGVLGFVFVVVLAFSF